MLCAAIVASGVACCGKTKKRWPALGKGTVDGLTISERHSDVDARFSNLNWRPGPTMTTTAAGTGTEDRRRRRDSIDNSKTNNSQAIVIDQG
jgi:hypothetical protein